MPLYIGLMSGTSLDGVDGVLVDLDADSLLPRRVLAHAQAPLPEALAAELLALNRPGPNELHRASVAANALMELHAQVVAELLRLGSRQPCEVQALGVHGQTVRHQPQVPPAPGYTVQLVNGALLAERTGINTVCDFRSADLAAGGQGAPLVPAFHAACFADPGYDVALLNIGGIANLSLLGADGRVHGFDTGPGNMLMDLWSRRHLGRAYDAGGVAAAAGQVAPQLLAALRAEPFFDLSPPKSTGRDLFNADWLDSRLALVGPQPSVVDVMATLAELTASCAADDLRRQLPQACRLLVCGGGAYNQHLMARLQALLPAVEVQSTAAVSVPPDQVEALAFAWLAACRMAQRCANLPAVTGAQAPRILGAVYAAPPTPA